MIDPAIIALFFWYAMMWKKTIGLDGVTYDSKEESKIANWLFMNGIDYEPHKKMPKPSKGFCDFYLPDYDLWVEYDGLMEFRQNNKTEIKTKFYESKKMNFVILKKNAWHQDLINHMELSC